MQRDEATSDGNPARQQTQFCVAVEAVLWHLFLFLNLFFAFMSENVLQGQASTAWR